MSNPKFAKLILVLILVFLSPFSLGLNAPYSISQSPETDTAPPPTETATGTETSIPPSDTPSVTDTLQPEDSQTPALNLSGTPTDGIQIPSSSPSPTNIPPSASPTPFVHLKGEFAPNEILVQMDQLDSVREALSKCIPGVNIQVKSKSFKLQTALIQVPEDSLSSSIGYLRHCHGVTNAEPNYTVHMSNVIPSDPGWGSQYGLVRIRAPQGWQITTGSSAVIIAVVDTGISLSHPDLSAKLVGGWDFVNNDAVADDDNGHGTHVAGIAAASSNNGTGVAGTSWGALLMPVKVLNAAGNGSDQTVADGIVWATDHGAQVINLSLGSPSPSNFMQAAVDYAYSHGVTVVAAAGNSGSGVDYPALYSDVIAVAATDSSNNHPIFSSRGPAVDVSAPGVHVLSTYIGGLYGYLSGTSMSAPFVSGLAAILRGIPGNGTPDLIAWEMETTALDLGVGGRDNLYGYGLIQMDKAIQLALSPNGTGGNNGSGYSGVAPFSGLSIGPTFTPTATLTSTSLALFTSTPTLTFTPGPAASFTNTPTEIPSQTPEVSAQQTIRTTGSFSPQFWALPCGGALLILLGILFVFLSRRKRRPAAYRLAALK